MKEKKYPILLAFLCLAVLADAQSIRRAVIGSAGASQVETNGVRVQSTVAQPPGAGTLSTSTHYLRQGFQQPAGCSASPKALFAIQPEGDPLCGGPFTMVYLDDPEAETNFSWDFGTGAVPADTSSAMNPNGIS